MKRPPRGAPLAAPRGGASRPGPAAREPGGHGQAEREGERLETIHGLRACLALAAVRPASLARVAFAPTHSEGLRYVLEPLLSVARSRGVPVVELDARALAELAGTPQHEGVCALAEARRYVSTHELGERLGATRGVCVALDRVRNPYNVGAIARSAAFLGARGLLLGAPAPHDGLSAQAVRVAEGGAEHLDVARTTDLAESLGRLKARGARVLGADGGAKASAFDDGVFDTRGGPLVLVLGNEREGLGARVRAVCDGLVAIPGTGAVESLNVSIAASVLLALALRAR